MLRVGPPAVQRLGLGVNEQPVRLGQTGDLGRGQRGGPAGDVQVPKPAAPAGSREQQVRAFQRRPGRPAGQRLIAEHLAAVEPDQRLEHRPDRPLGQRPL